MCCSATLDPRIIRIVSGSFPIFDGVVEQLLGWMAPSRALDIGAGAGKFGRMLERAVPACERCAIEVDASIVERFALPSVYQQVETLDATRWWREDPESTFDLILLGDCLQHLAKSDGLDMLNALVYRCAWLVVLVPEFIIQGAVDGADSSVHRSVWSERDMHWHDLWAWDNSRAITMFVMRGYQPSALDIDTLVRQVNDGALPVRDYDGQGVVRPCRLRLVDHPREVGYRAR
jgi:SAM-dependent methyltransferase